MESFLSDWQTLIGSIIGASTPIFFWFFVQKVEKIQKRKNDLILLEKILVTNINTLGESYNTIKTFLNGNFNDVLKDIDTDNASGKYSASYTFFPLFICNPIDIDLTSINSGSGYLDNKLLNIQKTSKDFYLGVEDLRNQLKDTILLHREIIFNKLNPEKAQNYLYKENLIRFKTVVERDMLSKNIKTYLELLITSLVVLRKINKVSLFRWKFKFSGSFKFFKTQKLFKQYININNVFDRIDLMIKSDYDKQYLEIEEKLIK
jgi:hypothetical protein